MDDAKHDAPHDYRYSPAPSPPSMVAEPAEAAILDELSIITHHLRRDPALRGRVLAAVRIEQRRVQDGEPASKLSIGTVESATGRVELPMHFSMIGCDDIGCGYCECDE